jgi:hypothetical protein
VWVDESKIIDFATAGHKLTVIGDALALRPFGISTWRTTGAIRNIRVRRLDE